MKPMPLMETAIYEVNLRAFAPTGDFAAVGKRLGEIHALGANTLWLMPIYPVGKLKSVGALGSPYSVADYDRVNPEFGTEADLKTLVDAAHARGMRVILDWVPNHTAWDNPWIAAHPDWYTRDEKGEMQPPPGTGWLDVAHLDYTKPKLRTAMTDAMRGWIERVGVDGFRVDTADFVPTDFWRSAIPALRRTSKRPLLMLAEGVKTENYAAGFDMNYGWNSYAKLKAAFAGASARPVGVAAAQEFAEAPPGKAPLRYSMNHDVAAVEGSPTELYKTPAGARTAELLAFLSGGVPLVYTGQEAGHDARIPIFTRSKIAWDADPAARAWITKLLKLRRAHPALSDSAAETTDLCNDHIVASLRRTESEEALVLGNAHDVEAPLALPPSARGEWTDVLTGERATLSDALTLPPFAARAFVRGRR